MNRSLRALLFEASRNLGSTELMKTGVRKQKLAYQCRIYGQNSSRTDNLFPLIYAPTITSVFTSH
ncbi:MAG: hypothetical protein GY924_26745 [Planctomycetaceae bacterium]|nr:hypothetical protein [Planctomycetaceae bacterium]